MKTDEELAVAEEEYVKAKEVTDNYNINVEEVTHNIANKITNEIKHKPFIFVVKVLVRLAAFFIIMLKPSSMKWFSLIRFSVGEFKSSLRDEIAQLDNQSEEEDVFGGVPMDIHMQA